MNCKSISHPIWVVVEVSTDAETELPNTSTVNVVGSTQCADPFTLHSQLSLDTVTGHVKPGDLPTSTVFVRPVEFPTVTTKQSWLPPKSAANKTKA